MGIFGKIGKALGGAVSGGLGGGVPGAVIGGVVSGLGKGGGKGRASGGVVRPAGGGGVVDTLRGRLLPSSLPRSPQSKVRDPGTTEPVEGRMMEGSMRAASAPSRREDRGPYSERAISRRRRFSRALSSRR